MPRHSENAAIRRKKVKRWYSQADKMVKKEIKNSTRVRLGHSDGHWVLYQRLKL